MNNKKYIDSFVSSGNFIPFTYAHCKKYPSLDRKSKEILLVEVANYLQGFDIVLSEVEGSCREEFKILFKREVSMASELKAMLSKS